MTRHLYSPTGISIEAQRDYANRLVVREIEDEVIVHAHGTDGTCTIECTKTVLDQRRNPVGPESSSVELEREES